MRHALSPSLRQGETEDKWVVRVGRPEDAEGYRYVTDLGGYLSHDSAQAYIYPDQKTAWRAAQDWTHGHAYNLLPHLIVEPEYLVALQVQTVEGSLCAMVTCLDFYHYKRLPEVVSHNEVKMGKTGWNSDTQHAFYSDTITLLHKESK